jgi:hypothetical protein
MNIKVEAEKFGKEKNKTCHKMVVNQQGVAFYGLEWSVQIHDDSVFLFTTNNEEIWRIRLFSKDNLFTGEWRRHIGNHIFELIAFLKLPEHLQFPNNPFILNEEYRSFLPIEKTTENHSTENQLKVEQDDNFDWKTFLSKLSIEEKFVKLELDDLQYLTKKDFAELVDDIKQRVSLIKYVEENYCKVE